MASHTPDLKGLFCEALDRPAGPERSAYLAAACRGDAALRAQVEELLAAHDRAGRFLAAGPAGPATAAGEAPAPTVDAAGAPAPGPTGDATQAATETAAPATLSHHA